MKKRIHYLPKELSILGSAGTAACGMYISEKLFGDNMTTDKQDVTCGNCLGSRIYKETREQQTCEKCGKIVGCDYKGRKHRCNCVRKTKPKTDGRLQCPSVRNRGYHSARDSEFNA